MRYLIGLTIAIIALVGGTIYGATIHIPQDYPTIQMGIDSASAGDSVVVASGIYYEHLVIDKTLSLAGENRHNVIIDGELWGDIVTIIADNVLFAHFTLRNGGIQDTNAAVKLIGCHESKVRGCIIRHNYTAALLEGDSSCFVSHCDIDSNAYGVRLGQYNNLINNRNDIFGNNIQDNSEIGIVFEPSNTPYNVINHISGNRIKNNKIGLKMSSSVYNYIMSNEFIHNDSFAMIITNCVDSEVANTYGANNYIDNNSNQVQAYDTCGNDRWAFLDHNYWSDYRGVDNDSNRYGDTPYYMAGGVASEDTPCMYPLTAEFWGMACSESYRGLAGVDVHLVGTDYHRTTDSTGYFGFPEIGSGHSDLAFHKEGYRDTTCEDIATALRAISSVIMWMTPVSEINDQNSLYLPDRFKLLPCYPNPFNSSTNIRFKVPIQANVKIDIYNILGQLIINLFDGQLAAGAHNVAFDATGLSSGIYFCRMESDSKAIVRKLQLIK